MKKTKEELRELLDETTYQITQMNGTERPFSHEYDQEFGEGVYLDVISGEVLFSSKDKFNAGCGWPSFSKPVEGSSIKELQDNRFGMRRTEVRTESTHLGHVFSDGPRELGGLRYCINGHSLRFVPKEKMEEKGLGAYLSLLD
ncbi:peptide-methionine (R)-S-oxide reductase MsrB [Peptoniphilus sp. KCTC 25270]|uniref:peptide-methionine (R)-S-oxide reductase MsrB n=1 Tax=Peptoniphilus sp. KCTC 25270 TaxID=2897414 RepID=UPI001E62FCE3|nr:peptide-methionine (R)-S-oxide reductase MsrB [Peptoniphilus sp. KCTC 25270]MCD1146762.1 peptide-methionine (R)-S-oxide reductase MsrB [Peptoniphilus sp. KCTC 25270]